MANGDPAVTVCFSVLIDGVSIGSFTTCEGIGCEVSVDTREEGGNNGFIYQLPGRVKFTNIKLGRAIDGDSSNIADMMAKMVDTPSRHTATIQAMGLDGTVVATWNLNQVFPVRWTGPSLGAEGPKVAMESLELAHHGFLPGS
jgi:phage tail-like protein